MKEKKIIYYCFPDIKPLRQMKHDGLARALAAKYLRVPAVKCVLCIQTCLGFPGRSEYWF